MKFDGTSWVNVGDAGFSAGATNYTSLAFSPSRVPYVAYEDCGNGFGATVMKYDSVFVGIDNPKGSRLSIYPNPAADKLTIELSEGVKENNISIVNLAAQELITRQISEPRTVIDLSLIHI